ncbi:GDSL esterase/lipase EXL3-like protein, partial [Tanacetum coccineum]
LCCCLATVNIPRNSLVQAVYAFGDSFADSGNNNNRTSVIKANFPPYGKDFMGGISTGRFTNRKTIADYVVEKLGVKDYLPAYLDPALQDTDLPTGVCFASGGAGVDELTSTILNVWSLQDQLEFFKEYIVKLKRIVGEEEANQITANALYLVSWGSNDWAVYTAVPIRRLQYNVPAYSKLLADKAENFIQELYNLGARRMAFFNTPAIACYPLTRTVAGGLLRKCSPKFNEEAHSFNNMIIGRIEQLNSTLPQARIVDGIILCFTVLDKGCCGSGVVEAAVLCNPLSTTCLDDSKYLFWDSVHLTDKGYDIVVDHALPRLMYSIL